MTTATSFPTTLEALVYGTTSRGSFLDRIRAAIRAANARRQERAARMTVRRYASARAADADDAAYWRQMSDAERVLHTWRLSVELWRLKGDVPDEPGLCRSVARVHRR